MFNVLLLGPIALAVLVEVVHAIPWSALVMDTDEKCFRIAVTADRIKSAPGFNKDS